MVLLPLSAFLYVCPTAPASGSLSATVSSRSLCLLHTNTHSNCQPRIHYRLQTHDSFLNPQSIHKGSFRLLNVGDVYAKQVVCIYATKVGLSTTAHNANVKMHAQIDVGI